MGAIILMILLWVIVGLISAFPLWAIINFIFWTFDITFRVTLLQVWAITTFVVMIRNLLKGGE